MNRLRKGHNKKLNHCVSSEYLDLEDRRKGCDIIKIKILLIGYFESLLHY